MDENELRRHIGGALCDAYGDPDAHYEDYEWIVSTVFEAIHDAGWSVVPASLAE